MLLLPWSAMKLVHDVRFDFSVTGFLSNRFELDSVPRSRTFPQYLGELARSVDSTNGRRVAPCDGRIARSRNQIKLLPTSCVGFVGFGLPHQTNDLWKAQERGPSFLSAPHLPHSGLTSVLRTCQCLAGEHLISQSLVIPVNLTSI